MAAFHVFVEGATDDTPAGLERLAEAIANHYGLNAADLLPRLQRGRFRVKGNTDRETADTYKRDLERLGARCVVEEANADNSGRATPLPFPAVRPETPPAGTPAVPASGLAAAGAAASTTKPPPMSALAAAGAAPSTTKPPPMSALAAAGTPSTGSTTPPPMGSGGQQFQSGLSAAFSGAAQPSDLGALSGEGLSLSLASVDGVEDTRPSGGSIGPAGNGGVPASIGPAPEKPAKDKDAKAAKPKDEPLDMFAPPEMQGQELKMEISAEDKAFEDARKRASTPPPINDPEPAAAGAAPGRKSQPSIQAPNAPARRTNPSMQVPNEPVTTLAPPPSKLGPLANERVRFVAGLILAVLIGFVPAHFIAKSKEQSADKEIDGKIMLMQNAADTPEAYATLDRMRADQLSRKESEHRSAAIMGFAIWALVGGAIAFGWFKKVPWDDLT